jgi:hypothetical protein
VTPRTRTRALVATALVALTGPATAHAAPRTCGQATVAAGAVVSSSHEWTWAGADGTALDEPALVEVAEPAGGKLTRGPLYKAQTAVTLRSGGHTFKLAKGSAFNLRCWGESPRAGARHPAVGLFDGAVTASGARVAVVTPEGLFNPHGRARQTIKVTRAAVKGAHDGFRTGSTDARKTAGGGWPA